MYIPRNSEFFEPYLSTVVTVQNQNCSNTPARQSHRQVNNTGSIPPQKKGIARRTHRPQGMGPTFSSAPNSNSNPNPTKANPGAFIKNPKPKNPPLKNLRRPPPAAVFSPPLPKPASANKTTK